MIKLSRPKSNLSNLIGVCLLFITVFLFAGLFGQNSASAQQQLSTSKIQEKAAEFCKTGDDSEKSACRNGYRAGYNGNSLEQECTKRDIYNDKQKQSCRNGYVQGETLAASAGSGGKGSDQCGKGGAAVTTKFNFGCLGEKSPKDISPIEDFLYAIIRFLSAGVGIAVVIAIIISGIQYSTSEGNPEATQAAKERVRSAIIALFIYLFAFSLVQFLVPGGVFTGSLIVPGTVPDIIRVIYG